VGKKNIQYEIVIGLEVHVQLATNSKLFSGDQASLNTEPNTHVSAITLAHPGTLPKTNKKAIELAIRMGLACKCQIELSNYFARKNYNYPDLPKGYQVSQHTVPICKGGEVSFYIGSERMSVLLNRIHLEEDAGKSIHDADEQYTCIDHNRAGTPLIEIVTEPCIHSAEDACMYVSTIRKLVRWLGVSDGNMESGNLRCDANISIREMGETALGTKVEVKNLNSIRNLRKAIDHEVQRLRELLDNGEPVIQQTRSFDANTDSTFSLRDKEDANDYRYFPDPDLAPFYLTKSQVQSIRDAMPELPEQLSERLQTDFELSAYDALQLTEEREVCNYFFAVADQSQKFKAIANWINGPVKEYLNKAVVSIDEFPITPYALAELIELVDAGKVSFSVASAKVFPAMISSGKNSADIISEMNLFQVSNEDELREWIDIAMQRMPEKVAEYQKGKKGLLGVFVGEVKKLSNGKADPKLVNQLLEQKLNNS
jgi:aspartyl-tRNA(Asn)/glutamyl-tRNA(Gln) amidotransferase subunit B